MKKFFLSLISVLLICVSFTVAACAPKTDYDNKKVVKIETFYQGGEVAIDTQPTRTFNFESGTVTDELVMSEIMIEIISNPEFHDPERYFEYYNAYQDYLNGKYNHPQIVTMFSEEDGAKFLKDIKSKGVYTWKDRYENHNIDDLRSKYVEITFSDGTVKKTEFYNDAPNNYKRIQKSFEKYLGVSMMWNGSYKEV